MKKHSTLLKNIMDTSEYAVLHRFLKSNTDEVFGFTDQELDNLIEYDFLSIMSSYYNMMYKSQKKYISDILSSKTGFRNLSLTLENLSAPMKDEVYVPYMLKLFNRIDNYLLSKNSYLVLFKYFANLIISHIGKGIYIYDYLALMNSAYFSVLADGLGISNVYTKNMMASYGHSSYEDLLDYLYKEYSSDINWDLEIDLNGIDIYLEKKAIDKLFGIEKFEEDTSEGIAEFFEIVNIVERLRGEDIAKTRTSKNDALLSSLLHETGVHIIKRTIISGFDCSFCESEDYSEEYVIIQRQSSYYRMLLYDSDSLERFLDEIENMLIELDMRTWPVHIIFVNDKTEPIYLETALKSDSHFLPRHVFSKEDTLYFLLNTNQRYFKDDDGYRLYIEDARWILDDSIYVPYLKIATVKYGLESDSCLDLKVVFYESEKKKLWAEDDDYDRDPDEWKALGLIRISTFCSNVGYANKISCSSLPDIYAEIFVNDEFYGKVHINSSYELIQKETPVLKTVAIESECAYIRKTQNPFFPIVTAKYWEKSDNLYVPYLKVDIINQNKESADLIYVTAVYYDVKNRNLWSYSHSCIITNANTPLKQGYRKTAFLKASVGYEKQVDKEHLPEISAELFINGDFYGTTTVDCSYDYNEYELPLNGEPVTIENDYVKVNGADFYPVIKQNQWKRNSDIYSPFLQFDIINQKEEPAYNVDLDVHFYNSDESESWDHYTNSELPTNVPLKSGFNISTFVKCPTGYMEMVQAEDLPDITAFVYINSEYYGYVKINKSYESINIVDTLTIYEPEEEKDSGETSRWNEKSFLGAMGYSTHKPENERHELLCKAVRVYGKQRIVDHISFLVNMRLAQENGARKYKRAIEIWKKDLVYVRNI